MSFLKNILKPFVEFNEAEQSASSEETKPQKVQVKKTSQNVDNAAVTTSNSSSASYKSSLSAGSAEKTNLPGYEKYFEDLIDEANAKNPLFQGTDFKEFIDSKIDVEAIADEETKYKTAFNVLKRTGLTKEKLVTTGNEYINIINSDLKGFEAAYQQQYKTEVEQKEQSLQKKAEELQQLSEKMAALNDEMKQTSQQIVKSKDQLNSNKKRFVSAGENKKNEMELELQKIEQYF